MHQSKAFEDFVTTLLALNIEISTNTNTLDQLQENCSGFKTKVLALASPKNKNELQKIVELANKYKISIFPYSTGCNWGFGSKVPTKVNCVLLSLQNFNKILKIDSIYGYAVIEAGVTQRQLYEALKEYASDWFFDVTGSSSHSSILGNALERGIAYNTQRVNLISDFEVLTGAGDFINTGCGQFTENKMTHLYRHGLGPSFEGLFFQSNFGIITQATISLTRKYEVYDFISISIEKEEDVPNLVESLGCLLKDGTIKCIPHIFNRERIIPVIAPLWKEQMELAGKSISNTEIEAKLKKIFPGSWSAFMGLGSSKNNVRTLRKKIRKALPAKVVPFILSERKEVLLNFIADNLPFQTEKSMLFKATRPTRDMVRGVPTDETLQSIAWPFDKNKKRVNPNDIDSLNAGFVYCTPFAPLSEENAIQIIEITKRHAKCFDFEPAISLNLVDHKILEGVLSVHFDKRQSKQVENSQKWLKAVHEDFIRCGFLPYRLDVSSMNIIKSLKSNAGKYWQSLKNAFDPNNIIAPNRYVVGEGKSTFKIENLDDDFKYSQSCRAPDSINRVH